MNVRRLSSSAGRVFSSFDSECAQRISDKLQKWPLRMEITSQHGNGLFATRSLAKDEIILKETPTLSSALLDPAHPSQDSRVAQVASQMPPDWRTDAHLLAQTISLATRSPPWRSSGISASNFLLELRLLGHTELPENADSDFIKGPIFQLLTTVFDIGAVPMWNPSECKLLYDKIKSNYFESSAGAALFEACSMLNHSCCPNVQFDPYAPDNLQVVRPVAKGEQLFISYQVEAQYLPELYGFHCYCEKCTPKK
jgi:hypothetical protein